MSIQENVKKVDEYKEILILNDATQIPINEIIKIELM